MSSERQELADRVRRVAVVEVQRHAAQQVVAGDQQPPLALEEHDVRRRVARRLVHRPGAEVGLDVEAGQQVAVGPQRPGGERAPGARRVARHAALAGDLDAAGVRGVGVVGVGGEVLVVGVRPHLAAGAVGDRVGLAAVVGVGVGDDHEPHVLSTFRPTWSSARSRWASEPGSCVPVSTSTIPSPAAIAHALQCGTPGHGSGSRSRQRPGEHALAAPHLPRSGRLAHGAGRYCPGMATSTQSTTPKTVMTAYFEALAEQDLDAIAAAWAPDGVCHVVGGIAGRRARRRARLLGRVLRRDARLPLRGRGHRRRRRPGRRALVGARARSPGPPPSRASSRPTRGSTSRARPLRPPRRPDRARARLHRRRRLRAPDRDAAADRLDRRAAHDARLQRPGEAQAARGLRGPRARRRGRLARARRLPAEDDERLPDRGRGRRGDDVRGRDQGDGRRAVRGRVLARRPQPDRARPRPRRPPRRGARAGRAGLLPSRPTGSTPRATAACTTSTSRRSGARPLDDPAAAAGVGRRAGGRSPARSRRATTSRASRSSTSRATRPARSRCGASPTAWR